MIRLDKYLGESGVFSRSEATRAIRSGRIAVNGVVVRDAAAKVDETAAAVTVDGQTVRWTKYKYVMLNKPADVISTTDDTPKSVMKLFPPEFTRLGMFPCGRLDIDTVGLLLVTNDGPTAHELLSPKHLCSSAMAQQPSLTARRTKSLSPPAIDATSGANFGLPREMCIPLECPCKQITTGRGLSAPFGIAR